VVDPKFCDRLGLDTNFAFRRATRWWIERDDLSSMRQDFPTTSPRRASPRSGRAGKIRPRQCASEPMMRRVVLLGGGHAHVHVLASAAHRPLAEVELVLVSPFERHHYSGMVPGFLQATYAEGELAFDLATLAARAGARFVQAPAESIDATARTVEVGGERLGFDWLSIDVGSEAAGLDTPGVREHAATIRPMNRAAALRRRAEEVFGARGRSSSRIVVIGGGAAGLEVALALERLGRDTGNPPTVTIVEAASSVLPEFSGNVRRIAARVLARRAVETRLGRRVVAVEADAVTLDDGSREPSDLTVWLAGAAPPRLLSRSDLPRDERGYLLVDDTLRAVDGAPVYGAGDCIAIAGHPGLAKAGVYAVRESPVLDHNLRAALTGGRPRRYSPQSTFLALLNTADGQAIWRWHGLAGRSRGAWWTKDRIDRAFVRRYQGA
jgi:selenide,water dikinase